MPSSKRNRTVPTSKVQKKRKEIVQRLHSSIQTAVDTYARVYVFDVQNMRNNYLKTLRTELKDSRIFMGKTKLMAHALGTTQETAHVEGLEGLARYMRGNVGLLFTDRERGEVEGLVGGWRERDYARAGAVSEGSFVVPFGELTTRYGVEGGEDDPLPMAVEPTLRKLGVPTRLVRGKVVLENAGGEGFGMEEDGYLVCREGDVLDSRQTTLLKIFGVKMAEFKVELLAVFDKAEGTVGEIGRMDVDT